MVRFFIFFLSVFIANSLTAGNISDKKGVYLPTQRFTQRKMTEVFHYSSLSGMNSIVLHSKDPKGLIHWSSKNKTALKTGAVRKNGRLKIALDFFKKKGLWTIAKLDVFADSNLAEKLPGAGILNAETKEPWRDQKGLCWSNPTNKVVWKYNIDLALELAEMGFDEIQFDYIRFPSDGELSKMDLPKRSEGFRKPEFLEGFLKLAYSKLKPKGVTVSVDLFGLTAWKKRDFGVGQVLEKIAPYVDVICPMLYPSHFPKGFFKLENPSLHPYKIMYSSMERMRKRTKKAIRPWIQGFWYKDQEINKQLDAVIKSSNEGWLVWNPTGNYTTTYFALEKRSKKRFPSIKFYSDLKELEKENERIVTGKFKVINYTNFKKGFSIISLEEPKGDLKTPYARPVEVIKTLEEAVLDKILTRMGISYGKNQSKYVKSLKVAEQMCVDIDISPSKMRSFPVYIDWRGDGVFLLKIPENYTALWKQYRKYAMVQSEELKDQNSILKSVIKIN